MPTPRKSLSELVASGTLQKNLGRYQSRIAAVPTITYPPGRAPGHFTAPERAAWAEILRTAPPGLLMRSDRIALEILVKLLLRAREPNPKPSDFNALTALMAKLGLTPSDRLRLNIERFPEPAETAAQKEQDRIWAEFD